MIQSAFFVRWQWIPGTEFHIINRCRLITGASLSSTAIWLEAFLKVESTNDLVPLSLLPFFPTLELLANATAHCEDETVAWPHDSHTSLARLQK